MILLGCISSISNGCYTSIISFGDSLADTGNAKVLSKYDKVDPPHFLFPPYGETYFHNPTGRCSNGRLIIDFLAESLGLPMISPYFQRDGIEDVVNSRIGLNYAVASATALDSSFHEARGYNVPTNASLGVQLGWFKLSLSSLCDSFSDCRKLLQGSLILMGEIGGNDYNHALVAGKSINQIKPYVPLVVNTIISTVIDLIDLGAQTLIVPGNLPIGCSPVYLTIYAGYNSDEYDAATGCLIRLNKFAEYHNELLKIELNKIQEMHPSVNIIYGDYYNAALQFYISPNEFGFSNGALNACCGGGGPFNYNQSAECSSSTITCADPNTYVNWDGLHLTEAAYKLIYTSLFNGSYTIPPFNSLCSMCVT
ncbi:GDSL esterase/lipase At1g28580-like [Rutidosis leptorrhynchoides]|uniref:GDSL esterase/lipase At1g28580-like n=1 Tax=Rutidosis leptorrhynchoides TaxID=125765 RepID=UPI003A98E0E2